MPSERYTVEQKRSFIKQFEEIKSLTTQRDFCTLHNLTESTFSKWLAVKHKLERTAGHKKYAQRQPTYIKDARALTRFLDQQHKKQQQVSLLQLLAHAQSAGLLSGMATYMDRYLFCRRSLYAHTQRNMPENHTSVLDHPKVAILHPASSNHCTSDYHHISKNIYHDEPPLQDGSCGFCSCRERCGQDCINQATATECDELNCRIQGQCGNKWLQNTIEQYLEVFQTKTTGQGLRSRIYIPKNTVVIEYCGEYMLEIAYNQRCLATNPPPTATYFVRCQDGYGIDARLQGNVARFANHSCEPNLRTMKRLVGHITRVFFVTKRSIEPGEELTTKYDDTPPFPCLCLACRPSHR